MKDDPANQRRAGDKRLSSDRGRLAAYHARQGPWNQRWRVLVLRSHQRGLSSRRRASGDAGRRARGSPRRCQYGSFRQRNGATRESDVTLMKANARWPTASVLMVIGHARAVSLGWQTHRQQRQCCRRASRRVRQSNEGRDQGSEGERKYRN